MLVGIHLSLFQNSLLGLLNSDSFLLGKAFGQFDHRHVHLHDAEHIHYLLLIDHLLLILVDLMQVEQILVDLFKVGFFDLWLLNSIPLSRYKLFAVLVVFKSRVTIVVA